MKRLFLGRALEALSAAYRASLEGAQEVARRNGEIVRRAMHIAGEICVYTNTNITVLEPT